MAAMVRNADEIARTILSMFVKEKQPESRFSGVTGPRFPKLTTSRPTAIVISNQDSTRRV